MKKKPLFKKVRAVIEKDLNENNIRWFETHRYTRSYGAFYKNTKHMPLECSYSTIIKALDDMVKAGLIVRFGNAHTVTAYLYLPILKAWALELENNR